MCRVDDKIDTFQKILEDYERQQEVNGESESGSQNRLTTNSLTHTRQTRQS